MYEVPQGHQVCKVTLDHEEKPEVLVCQVAKENEDPLGFPVDKAPSDHMDQQVLLVKSDKLDERVIRVR